MTLPHYFLLTYHFMLVELYNWKYFGYWGPHILSRPTCSPCVGQPCYRLKYSRKLCGKCIKDVKLKMSDWSNNTSIWIIKHVDFHVWTFHSSKMKIMKHKWEVIFCITMSQYANALNYHIKHSNQILCVVVLEILKNVLIVQIPFPTTNGSHCETVY